MKNGAVGIYDEKLKVNFDKDSKQKKATQAKKECVNSNSICLEWKWITHTVHEHSKYKDSKFIRRAPTLEERDEEIEFQIRSCCMI